MSSFKLLEIYFYPGPPGRAGENIFSTCVSLIRILRVGIAKHHAVEVVSKSQPLKLNSERALTPAVHWQIQTAGTVYGMGVRGKHTRFQCSTIRFEQQQQSVIKTNQELRPKDLLYFIQNTIPKRNILVPRSIVKFDLI